MVCDGLGRPLTFFLSPGQMSDAKGALALLSALPPAKRLLAEAGMAAAQYGAANMLFFEQEDAGTVGAAHDAVPIDEMEAGTLAMLPPGVKVARNETRYPEAAVEPFLRTMAQAQAAGLGVSYETLTSDLSKANFSSLRAGKAEERDEWRMIQRAVLEGLHERVFSEWLPSAMLAGAINLPMAKLDKFAIGARWRPRGWPSVNPKDDATAAEKEIALGLRSRTELAAARGASFPRPSPPRRRPRGARRGCK